jgi:hypothetical protein
VFPHRDQPAKKQHRNQEHEIENNTTEDEEEEI